MEVNTGLIASLFETANEYGKTSFELLKLKSLEKASDVISSLIPNAVVFVLFASFMLFFNLGLAFWLGSILSSVSFGFFIVAAAYALLLLVLHFFLHKRLKKRIYNSIIKMVLK